MIAYILENRRKIGIIGVSILTIRGVGAWYYVELTSHDYIYTYPDTIPKNQTILLLGTAPTLTDGRSNIFYTRRIQAVVDLRNAKKIAQILVCGDNKHENYNEPEAMKQNLMQAGIPEDIIKLDYAGFRTIDSIIRARDVFGLDDLLVVSQQFHIERAVTIGKNKNLQITGYPAQDVSRHIAPRVYLREILARMRMILDLFIIHTQPHFPS